MFLVAYLLFAAAMAQDLSQLDRDKIAVINTATDTTSIPYTNFETGPVVGNMLNIHYFPGLIAFNRGYYTEAHAQFTFVAQRAFALDANPRKNEFMSTTHYLRGMVYLYHSDGLGRFTFARDDFEQAIKWNPNAHRAYLELGRLYAILGFKDPATSVIQTMLSMNPEKAIADEARAELELIKKGAAHPAPDPRSPASTRTVAVDMPARPDAAATPNPKTNSNPAPAANTPKTAAAPPPATGKISINGSFPIEIYMNGELVTSTPATLDLPAGDQKLEFRYQDQRKSETYTIRPNSTITAIVSFDVVVDLNAQPWAEVFVAGTTTSLGQTPLSKVHVPVGTVLLFRNPSFAQEEHRVTAADRSVSVVFRKP